MVQPARLLIVDDEDAIIRLLTQFLTSRGYWSAGPTEP